MKERIAKLGNNTKMIAGALFLAALMAVNLQIGMNDGNTTDISLLGLQASIFSPSVMASGDLRCDDISNCATSRGCGTSGTVSGCTLDCDDSDPSPLYLYCKYDN